MCDVEPNKEAKEGKEAKGRKRKTTPRSGLLEGEQSGEAKKNEVIEARNTQSATLDLGKAYYVPCSTQTQPTIRFLKEMPTVVKTENVGYTYVSNLFSH